MSWEVALVASTTLSALGSVIGGTQQAQAYSRQAAASEANAAQPRINAGVALNTSEAEAQREQQQTRRRVASAANQAGASGVDPGFGSPLDLMADISAEGTLDAQIMRWKGASQSRSYLAQAAGYDAQAGYAEDAAGQAQLSGLIGVGTSVLGGAARYGSMQMSMSTPTDALNSPSLDLNNQPKGR